DHVAVYTSCRVVTVVTSAFLHRVSHYRRLITGVGNDLTQRRFHCTTCDGDTGVLVFVVTFQVSDCSHSADQCSTAARNHAFFNRRTGSVQGVFNACFLLFHFNFGSSTHFDYRNTASQFSYALLQFFAVVIRRSFFDVYTNLLYTRFDLVSVTSTINNSGVVFVHGYALGGTQVLNSSAFQIQTNFFRDHSTAGQYSDILQHSFTTIA